MWNVVLKYHLWKKLKTIFNCTDTIHVTVKPWIWESDFALLRLCIWGCLTLSYLASFLRPQCGKSRFLEVRTENCILEPRKPMSEDQQGVLLGVAYFMTLCQSCLNRSYSKILSRSCQLDSQKLLAYLVSNEITKNV